MASHLVYSLTIPDIGEVISKLISDSLSGGSSNRMATHVLTI